MGRCHHSLSTRTYFARELASRSVGLQSQISIQVPDLCAVVSFAFRHIREHKIRPRVVRVTQKRLMSTFFCLIQPVELLQGLAQNDVSFGCCVVRLQSSTNDPFCLAGPPFPTQEVAVSERRQRVPASTEIDGCLKSLHGFLRAALRHFRYADIVVSLKISGERLRSLRNVTQTPGWIILCHPLQTLLKLVLRLAGDFQLPDRHGVTPLANRSRSGLQVHHKLRRGPIKLRARLCRLVSLFINSNVVGASRKVSHFEV